MASIDFRPIELRHDLVSGGTVWRDWHRRFPDVQIWDGLAVD
ncbi:MAG: hypothetical protein ACKO9H_00305 [Planctomycetota bacterium]